MKNIEESRSGWFYTSHKRLPILLLLPAIVLMLFVVGFPMLYSLYLSFTNFTLLSSGSAKFIGLQNYVTLFKDQVFLRALLRTVLYMLIAVRTSYCKCNVSCNTRAGSIENDYDDADDVCSHPGRVPIQMDIQ